MNLSSPLTVIVLISSINGANVLCLSNFILSTTRLLGIFFGIYVMSRMTPHATVVIMLFVCTYNENQFQISAGAAIALCMSLFYSISKKARSHTASCAPRTALNPSRTRTRKKKIHPERAAVTYLHLSRQFWDLISGGKKNNVCEQQKNDQIYF